MEQDFYKAHLTEKFGLEVIVADEQRRQAVHNSIYTGLVYGVIRESSQEIYRRVTSEFARAECLSLGCTEIAFLIHEAHSDIPVFDTTTIHATAAADWAMKAENE
ncbi:hypothetical protein DPSP01_003051 [Paraphaeosphaeria sporulosa]|uniref:Asp/Glu racemase n=1 Tax=Paraphaeosphaeria sporulosa TaxID=1460663 RepID=A0A177CMI0_9PLEO|nr:Asp/Glu racemase [Paraphaeosphaeria sporulosa]OAG08088.1 Asp/Glu racemase [Paraphaeosphaeria sporulosa]